MAATMSSDSPRWAARLSGSVGRGVVQPQAGAVDAEQGEGLVDDVLEQARDLTAAADLGGDAPERVGPVRARLDRLDGSFGAAPSSGACLVAMAIWAGWSPASDARHGTTGLGWLGTTVRFGAVPAR